MAQEVRVLHTEWFAQAEAGHGGLAVVELPGGGGVGVQAVPEPIFWWTSRLLRGMHGLRAEVHAIGGGGARWIITLHDGRPVVRGRVSNAARALLTATTWLEDDEALERAVDDVFSFRGPVVVQDVKDGVQTLVWIVALTVIPLLGAVALGCLLVPLLALVGAL